MDIKFGDKIMLKKECAVDAIKMGYSEAFVKEIMEVIGFDSNSIYTVQIDSDTLRNLPIGGLLEYRLATDNEIKLDVMKKMFINKEII
jgi:hypothetical protein